MNHDVKQPPSDDWLARRIIDRYGQSPGLISTAATRRQAARLNRFGMARLPLLASVQRRYAPAMSYRLGDRSELRYAWPFAAARTLAPAAAIMPTASRGENGQSGLAISRPSVAVVGSQPEVSSVHTPGAQPESRPVGSITPNTKGPTFAPAMTASRPPGRKGHLADRRTTAGDRGTDIVQRLADPMNRPIRRVNRQAEPKVPIPIIQPARQSASGSTKVGTESPRVNGGATTGQGQTVTGEDQIMPHLRPASMASQSVPKVPLTVSTGSQTGSIGSQPSLKEPSQFLPTMKISTNPLSPLGKREYLEDRQPIYPPSPADVDRGRYLNPLSPNGERVRVRGSPADGRREVIFPGNRLSNSIPVITHIQKVPDRPNLGIVQRHWAATATVQRAAQSDTTSPRHMPLAMLPKSVMMSAGDTPQVQTRSTGGERLSSPGDSTVEEAPTAGSVPRQGEEPEYIDELTDRVLRKLKRHLAVESERKGWRQWP